MSATLDPRIIKFVVQIGSNLYTYQDNGTTPYLYLTAKGTKYANPIQNECEVQIGNLSRDERNFILTETSPYNSNDDVKSLTVFAGRISTGFAQVYQGDITNSNITQPSDILLSLKSATAQSKKSNVVGRNRGAKTKLSAISAQVAASLGLQLNFAAKDKNISNYSYSGSQLGEVEKINNLGPSAFIDDNTLVVKDVALPLPNAITTVNENTGMVGIPEVTEEGVTVKFLYNNVTQLGGLLELTSVLNPSANGDYQIYKLGFDLANRDNNFYYNAFCSRITS